MPRKSPPSEPSTDHTRAPRKGRTAALADVARDAQILMLRLRNVPVSRVAEQCRCSQDVVRRVLEQAYRRDKEWATASLLLRKWEAEQKLETLDAGLLRIIRLDPTDKAAMTAAGVTIKEWLAAVEASRRIKGDLGRLHGLGGPTPIAEAERPAAATGDPVDEARLIFRWVESFRDDPALYDRLVSAVAGGYGEGPGADMELALPGLNGETPDAAAGDFADE